MKKPDFIKNMENEKKFFSSVELNNFSKDIISKLREKKYTALYSERKMDESGEILIKKYILKSAQGFFLYFEKQTEPDWNLTIYFEESKESELQFFLINFLKTYRNDTINNRTA